MRPSDVRFPVLLLIGVITITLFHPLLAQSEEELDRLLLEEDPMEATGPSGGIDANPFQLHGFAELSLDLSLSEDERRFYNSEGRLNLKPEYEIGDTRAYADIDFYTNAGNSSSIHANNSLESNEFYIEGGRDLRWKVGQQRFNWGVGDLFQPTNLLDRADLREAFNTDQDDRFRGTYALSLKYLFDDYALELAFRPVFSGAYPPVSFYEPEGVIVITPLGGVTSRYLAAEEHNKLSDAAYAARAGGTTGRFDWHVLYYSGMNNGLKYRSTLISEGSALYLDMKPVYQRINAFGLDLAFAWDKLNMRNELLYSPDMIALSTLEDSDVETALVRVNSGEEEAELQNIKKRQYVSYSTGFDCQLWGQYGTVFAEWMQARYIDESGIEEELQSDILALRAEDKFFSQSLILTGGTLMRLKESRAGFVYTSEAEYDFKNGLTAAFGAYFFAPNKDEYVEIYDDKDMLSFRMKYNF